MSTPTFGDIAFTPAVRALQERHGSRAHYARRQGEPEAGAVAVLGPREAEYLAAADSFFIASVSETGWPYVQHRGGPAGFVRVIDPSHIAFADYRGNRQYVTAGNTSAESRVSIIVMDYVHQRRLKLFGRLRMIDVDAAEPALLDAVRIPGYRAVIERVALIEVAAFDWNCPQHITQRFTLADIEAARREALGAT